MLSFYFVVSHVSMLWLMVLQINRMLNLFGFTYYSYVSWKIKWLIQVVLPFKSNYLVVSVVILIYGLFFLYQNFHIKLFSYAMFC
jgi:hypothetical protein